MEPDFLGYTAIALGSPFLSFFAGVGIADAVGLYTHMKRRVVYLTAIPTAIVITGMLTGGAVVMIEGSPYYGYMQHFHKFLLFCGTVMFYGIASPELFSAIKSRMDGSRPGGPEGGA